MVRFEIISAVLVALLVCACVWGGAWIWAAVLFISVLCYAVDRFGPQALGNPDPEAEFPAAGPVSLALGLAHFAVLGLAVAALCGVIGDLSIIERLGLFAAAALFAGQVGHPNAHELIHMRGRWHRRLGKAIYCSILMGHHASAHPLVHHVHVGTKSDPVSARKGRGFWRFLPRAWAGSFKAGYLAEARRMPQAGMRHPYVAYTVGAAATLVAGVWIAGISGAICVLLIGLYAQLQVCLSDYVQHYGLRRRVDAQGKPEPVGPQHSWNSPHIMSGAMMLNAPRHSDHHAHPARRYPALQLDTEHMPMLPYSLPMMAVIALMPPLWRKIMDPRLRMWEERAAAR